MQEPVAAVRRRRIDRTIIVRRWPTLQELLPAPDLATADTARLTAIGPRRAPVPTLIVRPWARSRPLLRWWIGACTLALGALIVAATIRDRVPTIAPQVTFAAPTIRDRAPTIAPQVTFAAPIVSIDDVPPVPPVVADAPVVATSDERPSIALAEARAPQAPRANSRAPRAIDDDVAPPVKIAKRAKRAPVRTKRPKRWNPDELFLPK